MKKLLLTVMGVATSLSGCSEAVPPTAKPKPTASAVKPEASFEEQLAAIRAGESQTLKLSRPVSPEQFAQLSEGCDGLTVLHLKHPNVADADLSVLPELVSLRQLVLEAPVGDEGIAHVANCTSLEIVNLPQAQFSDAGLQRLAELPLLTLLRFGSSQVSDAGMAVIPKMPNLRFLHLIDVPITDAALDSVKQAPLLESFYLDGGNCTDEGLSCLAKTRPALHIHLNQLHLPGHDHGHDHAH